MKPLRIAAIVLCVVSALSLLLCLFTADNAPQPGVFDQRTLEIVLSFQQAYNAQNPGAPLLEVDPTDPNAVIDATTVALIMNAEIPMG